MATERRRNLPDMGVVNCRYSLTLDGNKQRLLLRTWEARRPEDAPPDAVPGRINQKVDFPWQPNVWYRFKLCVRVVNGKGILLGKVWPREQPEPREWTITAEDPIPNTEGAAGLYAYATGITATSPGAEAYFDNVKIYPNP
jgi:hypothetical protein